MFHNIKNSNELGPAINETNKWLLKKLKLSENSSVADLGCGNGSTLFWLDNQAKDIFL